MGFGPGAPLDFFARDFLELLRYGVVLGKDHQVFTGPARGRNDQPVPSQPSQASALPIFCVGR